MAMRRKDDPVEVLNANEGGNGQDDGPEGDELQIRAEAGLV
jgi:hypothetical protein